MSFVEIISVNVILHVGTTRMSIAVFCYFLLGENCFIVITIQSTSGVAWVGGATVGVVVPVSRLQGAGRWTRK